MPSSPAMALACYLISESVRAFSGENKETDLWY